MIYICWEHQDKYKWYYHKRTVIVGLASGEESIIGQLLFQRLLLILSKHAFYIFYERRVVGETLDFIGMAKSVRNIHDIFYVEIRCENFLMNGKIQVFVNKKIEDNI